MFEKIKIILTKAEIFKKLTIVEMLHLIMTMGMSLLRVFTPNDSPIREQILRLYLKNKVKGPLGIIYLMLKNRVTQSFILKVLLVSLFGATLMSFRGVYLIYDLVPAHLKD